jgi:hypothetical protein
MNSMPFHRQLHKAQPAALLDLIVREPFETVRNSLLQLPLTKLRGYA